MAVMMAVSACAETEKQPALEETRCQSDTDCQGVNVSGTCNVTTGYCVPGACGNGRIDAGEECDGMTLNGAKCPAGKVGTVACNVFCFVDFSACRNAPTCLDGERSCNGNQPQVCASGTWKNDGGLCEYGCDGKTGLCNTASVSCMLDAKQCNGSVVQVCLDNAWVDGETCPYGCKDGKCNNSYDVCQDGVKQCNGSVVQVCSGNAWVDGETCPYGCKDGACVESAVECSTGKMQCNGSIVQTCSAAGEWVNGESCLFGCTNGACNTELRNCEEGAVICNGAYIQTCKNNEIILSDAECEYGCQNGKCVEASKVCVPNAVQCNGSVIQTCSNDVMSWVNGVTCATGCSGGKCNNQCASGQVTCNGYQPQACSVRSTGNIWVNNGPECEYGCDASSGDCTSAKACAGLSSVENGNGGCVDSTTYGTCSNGAWTGKKTCGGGCSSNTCYAECSPGTQVCSGSGSIKKCTSDGGAWATSACPTSVPICEPGTNSCRAAKSCTIGGATVASGSKACDGSGVYSCSDGTKTKVETCSSSQKCKDGACVSKGECTSYYSNAIASEKLGCVTATAYDYCSDGAWLTDGHDACTTTVANATAYCDGSLENADDFPCSFRCNSGFTRSGDTCVGNPCSDKDGNLVDHDADGCVSGTVFGICWGGAWEATDTCKTDVANADAVCHNGACTFVCKDGFTLSGSACVSGATYSSSTDFEWITNSSTNYTTKANGNASLSYGAIVVVARLDAGMIKMNGKKWPLLRTDDKSTSKITVSNLDHGLGKVVFNYNGYDTGSLTITPTGGTSSAQTVSITETKQVFSSGDIVFDDASATGFVITSKGRIGVDDLSWTSQN